MGGIDVRAPDGSRWVVVRRWTNWGSRRARFDRRMRLVNYEADGTPRRRDEPIPDATLPVALSILELPVEACAALGGMVRRILLRKPWRIEAYSNRGLLVTTHRVGWDDSLRACLDIATQLASGVTVDELDLPPERGSWDARTPPAGGP